MSQDHERRIRALEDAVRNLASAGRPVESALAVYRCSTGPTITSGTGDTLIDFNAVTYDPAGLVTTGASWAYTCPADGTYLVTAGVYFDSSAAWADGERVLLTLYKNGSASIRIDRRDNFPANTFARVLGENAISCSAGDTLDVRVSQNSGSSIAINTESSYTTIIIRRIA